MQITKEQLETAVKQSQREYAAKWREANREHIRAYHRKWKAEHPNYEQERLKRKMLQKLAADNGVSVDEIEVI